MAYKNNNIKSRLESKRLATVMLRSINSENPGSVHENKIQSCFYEGNTWRHLETPAYRVFHTVNRYN